MKCYINHPSMPSERNILENITRICTENGYNDSVSTTIKNLFLYMEKKKLYGCCHAFSSVLYVAFTELGQSPKLYIGECQKAGQKAFDHSWITINDKIIDIAIYYPLTCKINSVSGPVIFDIDAVSNTKAETLYGINTGLIMSQETTFVMNKPLDEYMNDYPFEQKGLWSVLQQIYPMAIEISAELKNKYHGIQRIFVR